MNLKKMLLLASMAMAAVAFAAPAAAQADVTLTDPKDVPLEVGAEITTTSTELKTKVGENTLHCTKVTLHYKVAVNGPTHVVLDPVPAPHNATAENCHVNGQVPASVTNAGTGRLTINTWGTGVTNATFTSEVPLIGQHCSYTGDVHIQGAASGSDIVNVTPAEELLTAPEEGCEPGEISGPATLETADDPETPEITEEVPVFLDFNKTPTL